MKEKDVRDRINAFLKNRLQNLLVPASMGIGLALGACDTSALKSNSDSAVDSSALQPRSGGAGGGLTAAGGSPYGIGGSMNPGSGGSGGLPGTGGTVYGQGAFGGSGGTTFSGIPGTGGTLYGAGGFRNPGSGGSGGIAGASGTVYGAGGFKDAGPSGGGGVIDSGEIPEAGKGETGLRPDAMISEAGAVEPTDAKAPTFPDVFFGE
jgi:hypothetical protein